MFEFISVISFLIFFGSPAYLILGMINPKNAFFGKNDKATRKEVALVFSSIVVTSFALSMITMHLAQPEIKRKEQIALEQQKAEAAKKQAETQAIAKEIQRQIDTYGMTTEKFGEACETLITVNSGSNDFGFWDMTGIEEIAGSLFMQRSVYGKNAFGAKVEQRYKCWSENGGVKIEQIGVEFH
jgi:cell division protein FtsB